MDSSTFVTRRGMVGGSSTSVISSRRCTLLRRQRNIDSGTSKRHAEFKQCWQGDGKSWCSTGLGRQVMLIHEGLPG